ncbi:DUF952 domain-containing protein [Streptomyces sp. NBC_01142]|uniref:DUF952 domain-containing protein n=1 Tax=Streptomyces sp. NBC_01142 TaxID=2975865 RepID=UPI002250C4B4|nr:DUF952 domain-containing protein [Streptomyces sp. NBC_01142]MCX4822098.1 DUF952 domain-containing protein [Streptomyces sp. NBC_01142]
MLFHVVPLDEWTADVERPYAPASLTTDGFVHCSPHAPAALAIADGPYRDVPDLLVLVIDEARLGAEIRWEGSEDMLFPHVYGTVERAAVTAVMAVRRDADGHARELTPWV